VDTLGAASNHEEVERPGERGADGVEACGVSDLAGDQERLFVPDGRG
jgi:hypothetical protein